MKTNFIMRTAIALGVLTFSSGLLQAAPWVIVPPSIVIEHRSDYRPYIEDRCDPAPPPPPRYRPQYRDNSYEIRAQQKLQRLGYYRGCIDGVFGYGSQRALADFQEDRGLRVTGRLDRYSLEALRIY